MIWGDYKLKQNRVINLSMKDVIDLHVGWVEKEVWISFERLSSIFSDTGEIPEEETKKSEEVETTDLPDLSEELEDHAWSRWALRSANPELTIAPMFPDLSFVVRPDYPFRLAPGAEAKVYTRIPLAVGIYDKSDSMLKLSEINTVGMVKTWFGTFEDGELCYWLPTTASQVVRPQMFREHRCYCPVVIKNNSEDCLHVEKLCLRVDRLSIFEHKNKLWSDKMLITHEGGDNFSNLIVSGSPPDEAKEAKLIGKPRNPVKKGIAERTFKLLNIQSLKLG